MVTPNFTQDWFSHNIPIWNEIIVPRLQDKVVHALEVGCFEGRATRWMCENILKKPEDKIVVMDTFQGSPEHKEMGVNTDDLLTRFLKNTEDFQNKIMVIKGTSQLGLRSAVLTKIGFDLIYIDGSHRAPDVMEDAVLAWRLLGHGGIMVFDDYKWNGGKTELDRPTIAIDTFIALFSESINVLHEGYQMIIQKKINFYVKENPEGN